MSERERESNGETDRAKERERVTNWIWKWGGGSGGHTDHKCSTPITTSLQGTCPLHQPLIISLFAFQWVEHVT